MDYNWVREWIRNRNCIYASREPEINEWNNGGDGEKITGNIFKVHACREFHSDYLSLQLEMPGLSQNDLIIHTNHLTELYPKTVFSHGSITKECSSICFLASLGRDREGTKRRNTKEVWEDDREREREEWKYEEMMRFDFSHVQTNMDDFYDVTRENLCILDETRMMLSQGFLWDRCPSDKIISDLERARERLCRAWTPAICDVVSPRTISSGWPITLNRKMNFFLLFHFVFRSVTSSCWLARFQFETMPCFPVVGENLERDSGKCVSIMQMCLVFQRGS